MRLHALWVGKTQEEWVRDAIDEYSARIRRYLPLEIREVKEEKGAQSETARETECDRLMKAVPKNGRLVILDERGEELTSPQFADFLGAERDRGTGHLVFAVGGAYGFSDALRGRAARTLALSRMTFTHQMVRPFLLEQIYRGLTILNGEGYHH